MTKKDYLFNMTNLIKNRVYYHAPINYSGDINFEKIMALGIDLSLPVFIIEKPVKKLILKSFYLAQKFVDFNLIIREKNRKIQKKIKNCFVIKKDEFPEIEKLNINYKTCSKYHRIEKGNYLKIGKIIEGFSQEDFYLEKKDMFGDVFYSVKKFLLSGENYIIELTNCSNKKTCVEIEYNRDLERGYYSFKKLAGGIKITNLFTNKEEFFNASFGKVNENYSCVDGIENSTFARINLKANICLEPYQRKSFLINYGSKEFSVQSQYEMNCILEASKQKNNEVFNVKIDSNNKLFERNFNHVLPTKIWLAWLKGERDLESESMYLEIKNNIVLFDGKKIIPQKNDYQLNGVLIYDGKAYKKADVAF